MRALEAAMELVAALREQIPLIDDPGQCPYILQNGEEGEYGPNTCDRGCNQEPICQTCGPWPSTVLRAALAAFDAALDETSSPQGVIISDVECCRQCEHPLSPMDIESRSALCFVCRQ